MNQRILLVEDEAAIARGLCDCLGFAGFEVDWQADGRAGLQAALEGSFDLALLDVMLPSINGFEICKQLRDQKPQQAIMMLTAKGAEADILEGFQSGADDYMCKPFSVAQLLARVKAMMRRAQFSTGDAVSQSDTDAFAVQDDFSLGDMSIVVEHLKLCCGLEETTINRRDMDLLYLFSEEPGRIVSRRRILREIWGYTNPDAIETRSVDMHIVKLRKKLAKIKSQGAVETVRGEGYRWALKN